jgi:glucose-1-phosphate thymidylyltransferase
MVKRKGIILAGGSGTRLYPLTVAISKQLLPIYDKPMVYYPLTILMLSGIRDILVITTKQDQDQFRHLLGDGSQWGINLSYKIQQRPEGLAQAFIIAEDFLAGAPSAMVLGDNIFFGHKISDVLAKAESQASGATIFGYHVSDPERYGVVEFDNDSKVKNIIEKPEIPTSNYAITGLYFVDGSAPERSKSVTPSARGELEITSLLNSYLNDGMLSVEKIGRGYAWLDTGTNSSLLEASNFVRTTIERQGLQIGSPDEVAYNLKWITKSQLRKRVVLYSKNDYGKYLKKILEY